MRAQSRRECALFLFAAFVWVGSSATKLPAQQPTLPSNWQSLGPVDFAKAVAPFYDVDAGTLFVSTIDDDAVRSQAVTLVAGIDFSNSQLGYPVLDFLDMLANPKLADSDQRRIRNGLLARQDDWTGRPYSEFHAKRSLMYRLKLPAQLWIQDGTRWAQAGGQLSAVPPQNLSEAYLYFAATPPQQIGGTFSVAWQGQLNPPQTGAYTFSVSPINVNDQGGQYPVQVSLSVSVGGNVILTATAQQWTRSSAAINLTAGQAAALAVTYSVQVGRRLPSRALHATLSWQGPGVANSIVPASAFTLPDGSAPGLQTTYTWTDRGGPQQTLTRTEPTIDAAWTSPPIWLLADPGPATQAGASLVQTVSASTYVSQFTNLTPPVRMRQFFGVFRDPDGTAQILNTSQRNGFLGLIQSQPTLLDPINPNRFAPFFGSYRMGNPEAALQLFGTWATRHADICCGLPTGGQFEDDSRGGYRRLAVYVAEQMPVQARELEHQFLVTPDGRCCLPVAYTLAYSYLAHDKLADWTQLLYTRLQDQTLSGDLRVNWLLARAFAQEIRQAQPGLSLNSLVYTRVMDGQGFINQAIQAAQSADVKLRSTLELAGRLASTGQFDAATGLLQPLTNSATPDQQAILTSWLSQIAALQLAQTNSTANQNAASQQAYLKTLRQRRDQAAAQGNTAAVNRYNALLNATPASNQ